MNTVGGRKLRSLLNLFSDKVLSYLAFCHLQPIWVWVKAFKSILFFFSFSVPLGKALTWQEYYWLRMLNLNTPNQSKWIILQSEITVSYHFRQKKYLWLFFLDKHRTIWYTYMVIYVALKLLTDHGNVPYSAVTLILSYYLCLWELYSQ